MNRCLLNVSNDHYSSIQCWPSVALSRTPSSRAASAKFNLSMSRIYGWTETSWVRRTCRTTTYLRTSTATMSCVVYFSFLHYMFWLWYFWCMLLSKINATISITTCKFCWPYMCTRVPIGVHALSKGTHQSHQRDVCQDQRLDSAPWRGYSTACLYVGTAGVI